jgi:hypothetical protein
MLIVPVDPARVRGCPAARSRWHPAWSLAALALASAPVEGRRSGAALAGSWAYAPEPHRAGALQSDACGGDSGVRYRANGTWHDLMPGEEGRWSVRGRTLTERVTHRHGPHGRRPVKEAAGSARLRWFSPDHVNIEQDGVRLGLLRCPPTGR